MSTTDHLNSLVGKIVTVRWGSIPCLTVTAELGKTNDFFRSILLGPYAETEGFSMFLPEDVASIDDAGGKTTIHLR